MGLDEAFILLFYIFAFLQTFKDLAYNTQPPILRTEK